MDIAFTEVLKEMSFDNLKHKGEKYEE